MKKSTIKFLTILICVFITYSILNVNYLFKTDIVNASNQQNYIHLSVDDTTACFENLKNTNYTNLFEEPFFKELKTLNDQYGAKFTLYTYNSALNGLSDKYKTDFSSNENWLKIGFHSNSPGQSLANTSYKNAKNYWNSFVTNIERIASINNLDRIPRLEFFSGSKNALLGMRDANYGAIGFLSADDNRNSYYFNNEITQYLYNNNYLKDENNNLLFISTDIRADWFYNFTSSNTYKAPTTSSMYEELTFRKNNSNYANSFNPLIIFTHEFLIYDGQNVNSKFYSLTEASQFAKDNNIPFDYPQNNTFLDLEENNLFNNLKTPKNNSKTIIIVIVCATLFVGCATFLIVFLHKRKTNKN